MNVYLRILLLITIITVSISASGAASTHYKRFEYSEVAMGVRARMVVYAQDQVTAEDGCRAAFERIAYLEDVMSDYRPTSELMRLCEKAGGDPVAVSGELLDILLKSEDLSLKSNGAFDVTIGPVVKMWRKARKSGVLPSQEEIDSAHKLVGWRKVIINKRKCTVRLEVPGMQLDLGGIAKGYACDEVIRVLKEHGIKSALVEMGGDIAVSNAPPHRNGWDIEVANAADPAYKRITLSNAAVSSSGDTEQFVEIGGKHYSHIVDPQTGLGLTTRTAVTIIAPNCTTSDGLSTAVSVLGADKGQALVRMYPGTKVYVWRISVGSDSYEFSSQSRQTSYHPRVYYGAKFEPVDKVLHGAGQAASVYSEQDKGFERYAETLGSDRFPFVFMAYCGMSSDLGWLKERLGAIQTKYHKCVIPQLGLDIPSDPGNLPKENDERIVKFCHELKSLDRPVFVRIGYEFNGSWYTPMYQPESFIKWFRAIAEAFKKESVSAATLWCAYPGWGDPKFGSWNYIKQFYPGDEYVDWWCFDTFAPPDITNVETAKFLDNAELHKKPVIIGEATPKGVGADDASDWDAWFKPFSNLIRSRPGIKGHTYINWNWAGTRWPDWGDGRLETGDPVVRELYQLEMSSNLYQHAGSSVPSFMK